MPNPNDLSSYEFQSNPFMGMLGGGEQQMPQGAPQGMLQGMPQQGGEQMANPNQSMGQAEAQGTMGQAMSQEKNQLMKGENPGSTKYLMGAVQSLEKFITESDDKESLMLARGIVSAISRLIAKDQEKYMGELR